MIMAASKSTTPKSNRRRRGPEGFINERTLRSLVHSIAKKLQTEKLSAKETIALLQQQERLSEQLRELAAAQMETELAQTMDRTETTESAEKTDRIGQRD